MFPPPGIDPVPQGPVIDSQVPDHLSDRLTRRHHHLHGLGLDARAWQTPPKADSYLVTSAVATSVKAADSHICAAHRHDANTMAVTICLNALSSLRGQPILLSDPLPRLRWAGPGAVGGRSPNRTSRAWAFWSEVGLSSAKLPPDPQPSGCHSGVSVPVRLNIRQGRPDTFHAPAISRRVRAAPRGRDHAPVELGCHVVIFDSSCHAGPHLRW